MTGTNLTSRSGTVYFVRCGNTDMVKIGATTGDALKRISELKVGSQHELNIIQTSDTNDYRKLEAAMRICFADRHFRGDWFRLTDGEIIHALTIIAMA